MASSKRKKWVISKQGKFATAAGGLGGKPKVYETMKAAQFDIDSNVKLKGATVIPYGGDGAADQAAPAGEAGLTAANGMANGAPKAKAKAAANKPKRAAAGSK